MFLCLREKEFWGVPWGSAGRPREQAIAGDHSNPAENLAEDQER